MARRLVMALVAIAALCVLPTFLTGYTLYILSLAWVYVIAAVGLNLVTGYTGQLSIGHAGFLAIGAYSASLLLAKLAIPFWLSIPAAGLIAGCAGLILLVPALRLTAIYLAIATLAFGIAVSELLPRWSAVTGGYQGMNVPDASFFGISVTTDIALYYLALATMILMVLLGRTIVHSKIGRALVAVRDHEAAAQACGVSLTKYKAFAFFASAFFTGVAGGLYAFVVGYISPAEFDLGKSLFLFMMISLGGMASIPGSIIGAVFMTFLPHWLSGFKGLQQFIYGATLVVVVVFMPFGFWGFVRRWTAADKIEKLPGPLRRVIAFVKG